MSVGIEIHNQAGILRLRNDEVLPRLVKVLGFAWDYSGQVSVPEFDDVRGVFQLSFDVVKFRIDIDQQYPLSIDITSNPYFTGRTIPFAVPSLSWNNSLKTLTISPHQLPDGFVQRGGCNPPYRISFYHYK